MENETMTVDVSTEHAETIKKNAYSYNCEIVDLGLTGRNTARIVLSGSKEDLEELLKLIDYENPEA